MVFPVVKFGCESWAIKKAEHWRIKAFELWCWRSLLRVPLMARRLQRVGHDLLSEQQKDQTSQSWRKSTLNIYWRAWCWSWNSNTLATWCKEPIHWKRPWCWERLKVGEGDDRAWDDWVTSLTQWTWVWANSGRWWWTGKPGVPVHGVAKSQMRLSDWTATTSKKGNNHFQLHNS